MLLLYPLKAHSLKKNKRARVNSLLNLVTQLKKRIFLKIPKDIQPANKLLFLLLVLFLEIKLVLYHLPQKVIKFNLLFISNACLEFISKS